MQLKTSNSLKINNQSHDNTDPTSSMSWGRKMQKLNQIKPIIQEQSSHIENKNTFSLNYSQTHNALRIIDCSLGMPGHRCARHGSHLKDLIDINDFESYTDPLGKSEYRQAVADALNNRHFSSTANILNGNNIAFTNGATGGFRNVLQAVPGTLIIPDLCYPGYSAMAKIIPDFNRNFHEITSIKSDRGLPTAELIISQLDKIAFMQNKDVKKLQTIVVLTSPGNPIGRSFNKQELNIIFKALESYSNTKIVVDETYHAISFNDEEKNSALDVIDLINPQIIVLRSLSKGFSLPGIRGGLIVADSCLIEKIQTLQFNNVVHANCFSQKLMVDSLKDYHYEKDAGQFYKDRVLPFHNFCKENNLVPKDETLQGGFFVLSDFITMQGNALSEKAQVILQSFNYPNPIPTQVTDVITAAVDLFDKTKIIAVPWFREGCSEELKNSEYLLRFALVHTENKTDDLIERLKEYIEFSNTTSESISESDSSDNETISKKLKAA
ncbi:MAG: pyridoxal phosphate-dependent aminotransferase [Pseudomonadota bacterium]